MNRYDRRIRSFATCLSALAGYVDATGFLKLHGFYVAFMSGNSTQLGVGIAQGSMDAAVAAGLVASFVGGVVAGAMVGHAAGRHRRRAVLLLVAAMLAAAAAFSMAGVVIGAATAMALAMGAENAVFSRDGEVQIGLTYMTGTLVKMGEKIAAALQGGGRWAWAPNFFLWAGLVAGACAGAAVYPWLGGGGLWIAAMAAAALAWLASRMEP